MLPCQPAIQTSTHIELRGLPDYWCAWLTERIMPVFCTGDVRLGEIFDELSEKYARFPYGRKRIVIVGLNDEPANDKLC